MVPVVSMVAKPVVSRIRSCATSRAFFQIVTGGTPLQPINLTNLLLQNTYIFITALGMLIVIVAGRIKLSVGSVMVFIGALAAVMIVNRDMPVGVTMVSCIVMGAGSGGAQGYWGAYWKIPSFIVTLAAMLVFRGLSLWLLEGRSVGPFPPEFQVIATGFVSDILAGGETMAALVGARNFNVLAFCMGRLGVDVTLDDSDRCGRDIATIVNLQPSGTCLMEQFFYAGAFRSSRNGWLPSDGRNRHDRTADRCSVRGTDPVPDDGAVDTESMKRVLDCMIDQGVDAICILANYSEQCVLSDAERAASDRWVRIGSARRSWAPHPQVTG